VWVQKKRLRVDIWNDGMSDRGSQHQHCLAPHLLLLLLRLVVVMMMLLSRGRLLRTTGHKRHFSGGPMVHDLRLGCLIHKQTRLFLRFAIVLRSVVERIVAIWVRQRRGFPLETC
jgi:hypothetical protein